MRTIQKITPLNRFVEHTDISLFARMFEQSAPARIKEFVQSAITPITARDPRNRARLKATLLCFFDCQFNMARAAERLDIHVNTMRQGLDILRDVTGGWDDPVAALELHVALRLDALT